MLARWTLRTTLILAVIIATGCGPDEDKASLTEKERSASVKVIKVKRDDIASYIFATGTLVPKQVSRLGPKVEGRIETIYVDEGDYVEKGQPLVKLEQETYQIKLREAEAALRTAKAELDKAEVALANITKDWKRLSSLKKEMAVSEQMYDKIETDYTTAQAELELARARIKESEAYMAMAKQNLKDTVTYAPFSGFVVKKLMEKGEVSSWVSFQWEVVHLEDISTVKIECPVAETKTLFLNTGKLAEIEVDAYPGNVFNGKITAINPKVDPQSRTFIIKIEIPNVDFKLKAGMFARVRISEEERKGALQIPKEALLVKEEKHIVFKVKDGLAESQTVQLGISDGQWLEVREGLQDGELIVIEGLYALKDKTKVKIYE